MPKPLPRLARKELPLETEAEHERALVSACRAASIILAERGRGADSQQPLPVSTRDLLRRLPRART